MTEAPPLPHKYGNTEQEYRARDLRWHLRELADIVRAARNGGHFDLSANLGRAVRRP